MKLIEKNINISVPGNLKLLIEELKSLVEKGIGEVSVLVENSANIDFPSEGIDELEFSRIKEIQELPEWVVYDLFKTQGAISNKKIFGKVDNFE